MIAGLSFSFRKQSYSNKKAHNSKLIESLMVYADVCPNLFWFNYDEIMIPQLAFINSGQNEPACC
jgi:hypothetical protein